MLYKVALIVEPRAQSRFRYKGNLRQQALRFSDAVLNLELVRRQAHRLVKSSDKTIFVHAHFLRHLLDIPHFFGKTFYTALHSIDRFVPRQKRRSAKENFFQPLSQYGYIFPAQ